MSVIHKYGWVAPAIIEHIDNEIAKNLKSHIVFRGECQTASALSLFCFQE